MSDIGMAFGVVFVCGLFIGFLLASVLFSMFFNWCII